MSNRILICRPNFFVIVHPGSPAYNIRQKCLKFEFVEYLDAIKYNPVLITMKALEVYSSRLSASKHQLVSPLSLIFGVMNATLLHIAVRARRCHNLTSL